MWDATFGDVFKPIVDHLTAGVAVLRLCDRDDNQSLSLVGYNSSAQGMVPFELSTSIGKRLIDVLPVVRQDSLAIYSDVARSANKVVELGNVRYDDRAVPGTYRMRVASLGNDCVALMFENLTQVEQATAELERLVKELKESNAELDGFTHSVSHDLRAPLRAMHGFANILIEDHHATLGPEGQRLVDTIARNTVKMGQLIDDLLNFSRLGRRQIAKLPLDMNALVKTALAELDLGGRTIALDVAPLPAAAGDAAVMKQVWLNLLDNAVKYSRKREKPVIEITGERRANFSIYRIKDNGVGYDSKYASKLFGVFQRLHTEVEYEGTGVGLALVQRIIQKHGGWITGASVLGQGATFEFALPASS